MKKTISVIVLSIISLGLTSCKKEAEKNAVTENMVIDPLQTTASDSLSVSSDNSSAKKDVSSQPTTTIALSESNFDFGNIKKGDKVSHVYEITNTGKNPLIISEVKPGCGCTEPQFTKDPIMPGKKGKITLGFDSSNFDGAVDKYADVFANVEKSPVKLTFTANVQP